MQNFDRLTDDKKEEYHLALKEYVEVFNGMNPFLEFIESLRKTKPHLLTLKKSVFKTGDIHVKWSKPIYKDKVSLLLLARLNEGKQGNFIPSKSDKNYKEILNLVRTLYPMTFNIFRGKELLLTLHPFDTTDNTTLLNPMFDAIFFCSMKTLKLLLNLKIKTSV